MVGFGRPAGEAGGDLPSGQPAGGPHYQAWAVLMQRAFGLDVLACLSPLRGRLCLIATISDPLVVEQILGISASPRRPLNQPTVCGPTHTDRP